MPRSFRQTLLLFMVIAMSFVAIPQAMAQFALGSGEALDPGGVYRDWGHDLDSNSQRNSGGLNFSANAQNFSTRLINNPGRQWTNRSWNNTLGYDFSRDYRTPIFTSSQSNPAITAPLVRQNYNAYYRQTPGWSSIVRAAGYDRFQTNAPSPAQVQMDQRNLIQSEIRATHRLSQPTTVGILNGGVGETMMVKASSLRGLVLNSAKTDLSTLGLTSYDQARLQEDLKRGRFIPTRAADDEVDFANIGQQSPRGTEPRTALLASSTVLANDPVNARVAPTPHDTILQSMADRYASNSIVGEVSPTQLSRLSDAYVDYQQGLTLGISQLDQGRNEITAEDEDDMIEMPAAEEEESTTPLEVQRGLDLALRHGTQITQLSTPEAEDRFNELLASGEERLKSGQYFWAEKRFARALRLLPNNPLATMGLAQAQLGAGLYLTAANTLKRLMKKSPEMIDVILEGNLMPARESLFNSMDMLRNRISHGGPDAADYGLLLAFIGHQLDQQQTIDEGLAAIKKANPESPLLPALRRIWGPETDEEMVPSVDSDAGVNK